MRFGIRLLQHLGSPRELVDLAVFAEQAGFDQVWFPHDTFMFNTWVMTTAVAERTSTIEVCSVATNPYTTDPSEIATYAATLDHLSGGRAVVGIGMHTREMVEWLGLDAGDHIVRTQEAVEIVRALLRGETVEYRGEAFHWSKQCYLRFDPLRAEIPIYVAAFGPEFLRMSGAVGDGSLPMITPPESAAYMVGHIREGARKAGRDPSEVEVAGCAWLSLSEDRMEAADTLRPIIAYFGPYFEVEPLGAIGLSPEDFSPLRSMVSAGDYSSAAEAVTEPMLRLAISGAPDDVIAKIEELEREGVSLVNLGGPLGPDPVKAIQLMGERVIPHFRPGR